MPGPTHQVLDFIMGTRYEDLPAEMVSEVKRVFWDSIGNAIAATMVDKGKYALALARRFGGPAESAILGTGDRVSCGYAAFANGELMYSLDYDIELFPTHPTPSVIPATLALGEKFKAAGKDVILAVALGLELSKRLGVSIRGLKKVFTTAEGSEVGKIAGTTYSVSAAGVTVLSGAAGAGRIMRLNREKMANAIGLAAHFGPFPQARWSRIPPTMVKTSTGGWGSLGEIMAVLLADTGYTGDTTVLDGDLGYWRFFGGEMWDENILIRDLGKEWKVLGGIMFKPYPCCVPHFVMLDCFTKLVEDNNLEAEDIERVRIQGSPLLTSPFHPNRLLNHVDAQFNPYYVIAAAANRIDRSQWQEAETLKNAKILEFTGKVFFETHPGFARTMLSEPYSNLTTVEVTARGKVYRQEAKYTKFAPNLELSRMSDQELVEKFRANACRVLPPGKVEKAIDRLLSLERVEDISEVTRLVTL